MFVVLGDSKSAVDRLLMFLNSFSFINKKTKPILNMKKSLDLSHFNKVYLNKYFDSEIIQYFFLYHFRIQDQHQKHKKQKLLYHEV